MGNLKYGTNDPLALYMGTSGSTKAYYGTTEVYSGGGTDYSKEYLTFEIISGNSIEWIPYFTDQEIYYSINGGEWTTDGPGASSSLSVEPGDIIRFKGNNGTYAQSSSNYGHFTSTETYFNIEGNILSMIYGDNFTGQTEFPSSGGDIYQFACMFYRNGILSAENLVLPQDTRAYCYSSMFSGCTWITDTPMLPATSLTDSCYFRMFKGCTSLTTAPELPATTLSSYCYREMFGGCTSLTAAPELLAASGEDYCYYNMFKGCSSLSHIKCLLDNVGNTHTLTWVQGVSPSGTFVKSGNASWPTGENGIPDGWTVIDA